MCLYFASTVHALCIFKSLYSAFLLSRNTTTLPFQNVCATEAYSQQKAGSHDRTLADTWGSVPHYYGFETAGGFDEAREMAHGQDWRDRVFTGTDESVEDHKGTHGSDTEFFKGKDPTLLKRSSASP